MKDLHVPHHVDDEIRVFIILKHLWKVDEELVQFSKDNCYHGEVVPVILMPVLIYVQMQYDLEVNELYGLMEASISVSDEHGRLILIPLVRLVIYLVVVQILGIVQMVLILLDAQVMHVDILTQTILYRMLVINFLTLFFLYEVT